MQYYILSQTRAYITRYFMRQNIIYNNFLPLPQSNRAPYLQQCVYYSTNKLIKVTFIFQNGNEKVVSVESGTSILEAAHKNDIELEGACDGCLACSTCHVILEQKVFDRLPEPSEAEFDMLDLAPCLTDTSRLGCQVKLDEGMDGIKIKLPQITRNFYVDGHIPQAH